MVFDDRLLARSALQHVGITDSLMERRRRRIKIEVSPPDEEVLYFNRCSFTFEIAYPLCGPVLHGRTFSFSSLSSSDPNMQSWHLEKAFKIS